MNLIEYIGICMAIMMIGWIALNVVFGEREE